MFKATRGPGGLGPAGAAGGKEVYFADDGFAMGVAYCLAILKQVRVGVDVVQTRPPHGFPPIHRIYPAYLSHAFISTHTHLYSY